MTSRVVGATALVLLGLSAIRGDEPRLPAGLAPDQQDNLKAFLKATGTPTRYVPDNARVGDVAPPAADAAVVAAPGKPVTQYTVQITPHRVTAEQEQVTRADVYYYRPNPVKGRQGITVKYTVDLATGKPVGEPEVLTKAHTPVSREELAGAVAAARDKVPDVAALYAGREAGEVRWEYLQMKVQRPTNGMNPGDRVVRLVFTAGPPAGGPPANPVRVLVNLTADTATRDDR